MICLCSLVLCATAATPCEAETDGVDTAPRSTGSDARGTSTEGRSPDVPFARAIRVGERGILDSEAIAASLEAAIAARLPRPAFEVELRAPAALMVGPGEVEVQVEFPNDVDAGGGAVLDLKVLRGRVLVREAKVAVQIKRRMTAVLLTERLGRGELVGDQRLRLAEVLIEGRSRPYTSIEEVVGLRARRNLSGGHLLCEGDLETPPLVERGDVVQVRLERGAIEIELAAEALGDGWLGDRIRVRNPLTRKTMTTVVCGEGAVRLVQ
jgi:flagella basal body P-ring formation protein FlgA